jgi:hypothetical protein
MIPDDLLGITVACEAKYAEAKRKGYAGGSDVIAAVAVLKSNYAALIAASDDLTATKGFFGIIVATVRSHLACRATRKACVNFDAAIERAWAENRLHNRCLMLLSRTA